MYISTFFLSPVVLFAVIERGPTHPPPALRDWAVMTKTPHPAQTRFLNLRAPTAPRRVSLTRPSVKTERTKTWGLGAFCKWTTRRGWRNWRIAVVAWDNQPRCPPGTGRAAVLCKCTTCCCLASLPRLCRFLESEGMAFTGRFVGRCRL